MAAEAFSPSRLPPVTRVEVYRLGRGHPSVAVEGAAAQALADIWRKLPPGHQRRCHNPRYGVRFLAHREVACEATVCWSCHNVHGVLAGGPFAYEFDADADVSRELLREVRRLAGPADEP